MTTDQHAESVADWTTKVLAQWRSTCDCATWPKPCPYHEGMADALDAVEQWLAFQDLDVFARKATQSDGDEVPIEKEFGLWIDKDGTARIDGSQRHVRTMTDEDGNDYEQSWTARNDGSTHASDS